MSGIHREIFRQLRSPSFRRCPQKRAVSQNPATPAGEQHSRTAGRSILLDMKQKALCLTVGALPLAAASASGTGSKIPPLNRKQRPPVTLWVQRYSQAPAVPEPFLLCASSLTSCSPPARALRSAPSRAGSSRSCGRGDGEWPRSLLGIPDCGEAGAPDFGPDLFPRENRVRSLPETSRVVEGTFTLSIEHARHKQKKARMATRLLQRQDMAIFSFAYICFSCLFPKTPTPTSKVPNSTTETGSGTWVKFWLV